MKTKGITGIEADGNFRDPMRVFMEYPWRTEYVCNCAEHVFIVTVLRSIGSILMRILNSSTCVTVHTFQGSGVSPSWTVAALFRNLLNSWNYQERNLRQVISRLSLVAIPNWFLFPSHINLICRDGAGNISTIISNAIERLVMVVLPELASVSNCISVICLI